MAYALYFLRLRRPGPPPSDLIDRLRKELPDITITVDEGNRQVTFAAAAPFVRSRVHAALEAVCGPYQGGDSPGWTEHFLVTSGNLPDRV